ncbi:MAG: NAD-dependent succinate-semialdehyde dehydrogenase [Proteobacteria bacterium]|nr:NAD-dependent succinate-semialdehyde dehydrogenase [Pseudomonadota bacterium]
MNRQTEFPNEVLLFIDGNWRKAGGGDFIPILNPASGATVGQLASANVPDIEEAALAAAKGFKIWKAKSANERQALMRKAAGLLRERAAPIAKMMTIEQGKPLAQARMETLAAADVIDWMAEEARRTYGRVIPARSATVDQRVLMEPVGPVAAFTPWNFPINQAVRKIAAALAAGCSIIVKGPEDTPASCAELIRAFVDAGIPGSVVQLLYGKPAEISAALIAHPAIRKISFTGSTAVGKQLAALCGTYMKRMTMELGGHAPVIVCDDADLDRAIDILSANKYRNAGQVCVAPTRFLVQDKVFQPFVDRFKAASEAQKIGDGLEDGVTMGPLAHARRVTAVEDLVNDAVGAGAKVVTGGKRVGNSGYFYAPTVLTDVPTDSRIMNEEPFGPVALVNRFAKIDEAISEANRLDYGLAAYAYSRSAGTIAKLFAEVEAGMVSINHHGIALPETPFGGIKDSGYGSEGGLEGIQPYLQPKFATVDLRLE